MMLLAVVSSSAAVEWVKVARIGISTIYADPATITGVTNWLSLLRLSSCLVALRLS